MCAGAAQLCAEVALLLPWASQRRKAGAAQQRNAVALMPGGNAQPTPPAGPPPLGPARPLQLRTAGSNGTASGVGADEAAGARGARRASHPSRSEGRCVPSELLELHMASVINDAVAGLAGAPLAAKGKEVLV
eukprot:CAMPEP_0179025848 /NCGR_PEP_ID=MMETSP0796-20121207/8203_1 /TAXON_ID=73915 /ORGANISM="Pyrodinium bahamense, Strain pbaha01" /LENGTH=132 /DNA_ID=CAMNT_0020721895 /DNA_START=1324 /DNA_END=1720 /DNA_ORIENTATION=+